MTTTWLNSCWAASSSRAVSSRRATSSGESVPRPTSRVLQRLLARRRDEHLGRLGHRLADLARALDLDLEQHRRAAGAALLELVAQRSVAAAGVAGVLDEVARVRRVLELVVGEEVVVDAVGLPGARRRVVAETDELELGHALAQRRG